MKLNYILCKGVILCATLLSKNFIAQDTLNSKWYPEDFEEIIISDRPDQTEAPQLTPNGFFQVETGSQSEYTNDIETGIKTSNVLLNTTLLKYGVNKSFELRL